MEQELVRAFPCWPAAVRRRWRVLEQQGGRCLMCRRQLFDTRDLKRAGHTITSARHGWVRWRAVDGTEHKGRQATVDHIVESPALGGAGFGGQSPRSYQSCRVVYPLPQREKRLGAGRGGRPSYLQRVPATV